MNKRERQHQDSMRIVTWTIFGVILLFVVMLLGKGVLYLIDYFFPPLK